MSGESKLKFSEELGPYRIDGQFSPDKMKLFLEVTRETIEQTPLVMDDLRALIAQYVPQDLVDEGVLRDIVDRAPSQKQISSRRVAQGVLPQAGRDGRLLFLVRPFQASRGASNVLPPGALRTLEVVPAGIAIARVYEPGPGVPGKNVLGQPIPAGEGKQVDIQTDPSLSSESSQENFCELIAQCPGFVFFDGKQLRICPELIVNGDVDSHSGPLNFPGNVSILGSVKTGLSIVASGGITVKNDVASATLVATDGAISVGGRIQGEGKVRFGSENISSGMLKQLSTSRRVQISSSGNLQASMLESVSAEVGGELIVEKEIRNCTLHVHGAVEVKRGHLLGGEVLTSGGVESAFLGTQSGSTTRIVLGRGAETTKAYMELEAELEQLEHARKMLQIYLGTYSENRDLLKRLTSKHQNRIRPLIEKFDLITAREQEIEKQKTEMRQGVGEAKPLRVNYMQWMYPGVIIEVDDKSWTPEQPLRGPGTIEFIEEFAVVPYRKLAER